LFVEWLIENKIDIDLNFNIQVDLDTLYSSYAEEKNRIFVPVATERLLKLFSIFYGKEVKNDIKFLSAIQLNLLDAEKENDMSFIGNSNFDDVIQVVEEVAENHKNEFSSNNIFNKLLEDLYSVKNLKKNGYIPDFVKGSLVLKPTEETLNKSKEYLKSILEG